MDTTKTVTHISLCAGYGGIDLGLRRAIPHLRTIAFSEIEAFACANLVAKMEAGLLDAAPIWTDVKTFPWARFHGKVDILSGGYPCQPFSAAGKRLGKDDPRHLWPWIADGIRLCQPRVCFFENVEGHISLGLREVIGELEEIGYRATWGIFSAAEVGAPHQRKRVFVLAHRYDAGLQGGISARVADSIGRKKPGYGHVGSSGYNGPELADSGDGRRRQDRQSSELRTDVPFKSSGNRWSARPSTVEQIWPSRPGQPQHRWEPPRVVGNPSQLQRDGSNDNSGNSKRSEEISESGNASWQGLGNADCRRLEGPSAGERRAADVVGNHGEGGGRKTEPALGRDPNGPASGMDYAELCVTCDNRTDELRLLGNGVVPATAERAFNVLASRLFL